MRFLADMGVSPRIVSWLRVEGHDAKHLREEGLQKLSDVEIFQKAQAEGRIVLTFDLDFGEIAALSGGKPGTTIVFRLRDTRTEVVQARLQTTLRELGDVLGRDVVVTVEESRQRVRWLPIGRTGEL